MGRAAKREHLARVLQSHAQSIHETLQIFEKPADSSLEKVEWPQVTKLGEEVSKQATITGMLWSGETSDVKELEENMAAYCNILQGFLLLCHGSTVGAGPTLLANIHASAKLVTEHSLSLLREPITSYGCNGSDKKLLMPQLSGAVWEACAALKKTPSTNSVAIGRAITKVAVSVKDVLREMRELKLAAPESIDASHAEISDAVSENHGEDGPSEDEFGNDLSMEEMSNANLVITVVSDTLVVIKELIRFITSMLKGPDHQDKSEIYIESLEKLLKHCQEIGGQIDELGACVYPPQEVSLMKTTSEKIIDEVNGIKFVVGTIGDSTNDLIGASDLLKISLTNLQSKVVSTDGDLVSEMEKTCSSLSAKGEVKIRISAFPKRDFCKETLDDGLIL